MGLTDASLSDVTSVYSHPQALMQCGDYLYSHSEWDKISMKNTAVAAKKIKEDGDKSQAAIASHRIENHKYLAPRRGPEIPVSPG